MMLILIDGLTPYTTGYLAKLIQLSSDDGP